MEFDPEQTMIVAGGIAEEQVYQGCSQSFLYREGNWDRNTLSD